MYKLNLDPIVTFFLNNGVLRTIKGPLFPKVIPNDQMKLIGRSDEEYISLHFYSISDICIHFNLGWEMACSQAAGNIEEASDFGEYLLKGLMWYSIALNRAVLVPESLSISGIRPLEDFVWFKNSTFGGDVCTV